MSQAQNSPLANLQAQILTLKEAITKKQKSEALIGDRALASLFGNKSGLSASVLQKISAGTYDGNVEKVRQKFAIEAAELRKRFSIGTFAGVDAADLYETEKWKDLLAATKIARKNAARGENKKIVWNLDFPGFGKTTNAQRLAATLPNCSALTALESWKNSFFACLSAIAHSAGITSRLRGSADAESKLFETLNLEKITDENPAPILALDEFEFCGNAFTRFCKLLSNQTPLVLVIFCQPQFFDDFQRQGGIHWDQTVQRNVAVLHPEPIAPAHASHYLTRNFPALSGPRLEELAFMLADHANGIHLPRPNYQGGGFRHCRYVCEGMREILPAGKLPTVQNLKEQISVERIAQGLKAIF